MRCWFYPRCADVPRRPPLPRRPPAAHTPEERSGQGEGSQGAQVRRACWVLSTYVSNGMFRDFPTSNSVHKTNNMASRLEDPVLKNRFKEGWGALTPDVIEVTRTSLLLPEKEEKRPYDQTLLAASQANSSRKYRI